MWSPPPPGPPSLLLLLLGLLVQLRRFGHFRGIILPHRVLHLAHPSGELLATPHVVTHAKHQRREQVQRRHLHVCVLDDPLDAGDELLAGVARAAHEPAPLDRGFEQRRRLGVHGGRVPLAVPAGQVPAPDAADEVRGALTRQADGGRHQADAKALADKAPRAVRRGVVTLLEHVLGEVARVLVKKEPEEVVQLPANLFVVLERLAAARGLAQGDDGRQHGEHRAVEARRRRHVREEVLRLVPEVLVPAGHLGRQGQRDVAEHFDAELEQERGIRQRAIANRGDGGKEPAQPRLLRHELDERVHSLRSDALGGGDLGHVARELDARALARLVGLLSGMGRVRQWSSFKKPMGSLASQPG